MKTDMKIVCCLCLVVSLVISCNSDSYHLSVIRDTSSSFAEGQSNSWLCKYAEKQPAVELWIMYTPESGVIIMAWMVLIWIAQSYVCGNEVIEFNPLSNVFRQWKTPYGNGKALTFLDASDYCRLHFIKRVCLVLKFEGDTVKSGILQPEKKVRRQIKMIMVIVPSVQRNYKY